MHRKKLLLTGATGFVGRNFSEYLRQNPNYAIRAVVRQEHNVQYSDAYCIKNLDETSSWKGAFTDCDAVVHAAARVHVLREQATAPLSAFREINVGGTLQLARQAAIHGVKRFIYLSSIKVNGERTPAGVPFTPALDRPTSDPYGLSKFEAEMGLKIIARETGMEVVIIRPPLIYGPGVKGNFQRLMQALQKGYPLPLGGCRNKRSFVSIDNLCHLMENCLDHPAAANQTFLVSDGMDLSTPELLQKMAKAMRVKLRLFQCPESALRIGAKLLGKTYEVSRLIDSLQVDISHTQKLLHWQPPYSIDETLERMATGLFDCKLRQI